MEMIGKKVSLPLLSSILLTSCGSCGADLGENLCALLCYHKIQLVDVHWKIFIKPVTFVCTFDNPL